MDTRFGVEADVVVTANPVWESVCHRLDAAAGRRHDGSETHDGVCTLVWWVPRYADALALRAKIAVVGGVLRHRPREAGAGPL